MFLNHRIHTAALEQWFDDVGCGIEHAKNYGLISNEEYHEAAQEYWRLFYLSGCNEF